MDHLRVVVLTIDQIAAIRLALINRQDLERGGSPNPAVTEALTVVQAAFDRPTYTHEEATP